MEEEDEQDGQGCMSIDDFIQELRLRMIITIEWLGGHKRDCPNCGARLIWFEDIDGGDHPVDFDGNNHFLACERQDRWIN
mgnify:FL=1|tara:strand:- start:250 stop:489 length:240 start_codon:yes stop_codon:yes gene_type:complete